VAQIAPRVSPELDAEAAVAELLEQRRIIAIGRYGEGDASAGASVASQGGGPITTGGMDASAGASGLGDDRLVAAAEDASRLRDALGVALPPGLPAAFTESVDDPLGDLVSRFARTHGPFLTAEVVAELGVEPHRVVETLEDLERQGRIVRGEFRPDGVEREWCHADVLRVLRRRSLAALRSEVEPVEPEVLARFVPAWQHVGSRLRSVDGLAEVLTTLQGAALPASALESDILPARIEGYQPSDLDTLLTAGEVVWVGAGALGADDGRVLLVWRDQVSALVPEPDDEGRPGAPLHDALRAHLAQRGASFWPELVAAAQSAGCDYDDRSVLGALWDLVWAGEVTNDSLTPLRALVSGTGPKKPTGRGSGRARRPNLRALSRIGPPSGTGRWALVTELRGGPAITPTEAATSRALQLLERYGVLTREMALAEGAEGGFAGVYPILKEMEERGQVRRGYFVTGLGAAQFALPGAVDRLRDLRRTGREADEEPSEPLTLAAVDPGQPWGAALPWPEVEGRPARTAGAYLVTRDGVPLVYLHRGGRSLVAFAGAADDPSWVPELTELVRSRRVKSLEIQKVNSDPVTAHPEIQELLLGGGFKPGYKGPTFRR
jgi:ATP-dependent Lhr-like helicase